MSDTRTSEQLKEGRTYYDYVILYYIYVTYSFCHRKWDEQLGWCYIHHLWYNLRVCVGTWNWFWTFSEQLTETQTSRLRPVVSDKMSFRALNWIQLKLAQSGFEVFHIGYCTYSKYRWKHIYGIGIKNIQKVPCLSQQQSVWDHKSANVLKMIDLKLRFCYLGKLVL